METLQDMLQKSFGRKPAPEIGDTCPTHAVDPQITEAISRYPVDSATLPLSGIRRLIILVPDYDVDEALYAQKIWAITPHQAFSGILLVSLVNDTIYGPEAQRRLVTLAALTQNSSTQINTQVLYSDDWMVALRGMVHPGDMLVCHEEQQVSNGRRLGLSFEESLSKAYGVPVYVLSGLYRAPIEKRSRVFQSAMAWLALFAILAGFFVLEAGIQQIAAGWVSNILFMLAFALEISLIWFWFRQVNKR